MFLSIETCEKFNKKFLQIQIHCRFVAALKFGAFEAFAPEFSWEGVLVFNLEAQLFEKLNLVGERNEFGNEHAAGLVD